MPFNGSGSYSAPSSSWNPAVGGTTISSTDWNSLLTDLETALSTVITKDGQTTITANLPMSGFKHTGVNTGSGSASRSEYTAAAVVQDGAVTWCSTAGGPANALTLAPSPAIAAYAAGQKFRFIAGASANSAAATVAISGLTAKAIQNLGQPLQGGEILASKMYEITYDGTAFQLMAVAAGVADNSICQGRLTLTSGTPVTTTDVTGAETIYFTPYKGNRIALYTGSAWVVYPFAEVSADVPDAAQMNDVFIYDNAGTLTLDVTAWTNDTTRATALTLQDGVYVKSGATSRRYLGSFYSNTTGNGQTEDSVTNRFVWNYYNRVERAMRAVESTNSWTYSLATFQQANGNPANQLNLVIGVSEDLISAQVYSVSNNNTASPNASVGIGLGSSTVDSSQIKNPGYTSLNSGTPGIIGNFASWRGYTGIGKRDIRWLEAASPTGVTTWYGDNNVPAFLQSGIYGEVMA